VYNNPGLTSFDSEREVTDDYADGTNLPTCANFAGDADNQSTFVGASLSGHFTTPWNIDYTEANSLTQSAAQSGASQTSSSGDDSSTPAVGDETTWTYALSGGGTTDIFGTTCDNSASGSTVTLTSTVTTVPAAPAFATSVVSGSFTIATSCGTYAGTVGGSGIFVPKDFFCLLMLPCGTPPANTWFFRGSTTITGGTAATVKAGARGGFTTDLVPGAAGNGNDTLSNYRNDAIVENR
jgi:hypothetical protein